MNTKNLTLSAMIANYNTLATKAGLPTRKSFDNKAKAAAAIAEVTKLTKAAKTKVSNTENGFRFGPVWQESIIAGSGVALREVNRPKLEAAVKHFNVTVPENASIDQLAAAIANVIR